MSNKNNSICSLVRPQTPVAPFPYREEAVTYPTTDSITLSGILSMPHGDGPFPAILLVAGMGPHDRDYTMMGHKLFLVLADYLTRRGFAVLRYDKRGIGQSTGTFDLNVTGKELGEDIHSGIAYLRSRSDINQHNIGMLGHSEGGALVIRAVQQLPEIAFMITLAPAIGTSIDSVLAQVAQQLAADGAPASLIQIDRTLREQLLNFAMQESAEQAQQNMQTCATAYFAQLPAADVDALEQFVFTLKKSSIDNTITLFNSPAYRYILHNNVQIDYIKTPILALNGMHDFITVSTINLPVVEHSLDNTIRARSRVVEIDHANHWFQTCTTGALAEYGAIEETIQPAVLTLIVEWIQQQL